MAKTIARNSPKRTDKPEMPKTSLRLPAELWKATKIEAIKSGKNAQDLVAEALRQYLHGKGGAR